MLTHSLKTEVQEAKWMKAIIAAFNHHYILTDPLNQWTCERNTIRIDITDEYSN